MTELIFDPNAIDFENPPNFETDLRNPTKYLKAVWAYSTTPELVCTECDSIFPRSQIWNTHIQPMIDFQIENNSHPIRDFDSWKDLLYFECPECGVAGNIEYDSANSEFQKIGYTSKFNPEIDSSDSKSRSERVIDVSDSGEDDDVEIVDDRKEYGL